MAELEKTVLRGTGRESPRRALVLDEQPIVEERRERFDLPKIELIQMIECLESQNARFIDYLNTYEAIQQSDRKALRETERRIKELEAEYVADMEARSAHAKLSFTQMVLGLAHVIQRMGEGRERTTAAMAAVRRVEATLRAPGGHALWQNPTPDLAYAFRALCKVALYLPRPNTASGDLYDLIDEHDHMVLSIFYDYRVVECLGQSPAQHADNEAGILYEKILRQGRENESYEWECDQ